MDMFQSLIAAIYGPMRRLPSAGIVAYPDQRDGRVRSSAQKGKRGRRHSNKPLLEEREKRTVS